MANTNRVPGRRISRRQTTLIWIASVTVVVIALLYFERADILYVLSTVGVAVLLITVAAADLSGSKKTPTDTTDDWNAKKA